MSKKFYVAIAAIIKGLSTNNQINTRELIDRLAIYFLADNPRFDRDRFYRACEK